MNKHGLTMKELSIEQKAKAYDEAKARMSKAYNSNRCTIGFMNEIFPEFKDEDERIKEEIINYFECQSRDEPCRKSIHDKWIAWIEKQGQTFTKEEVGNANKVEPKDYNGIDPYFGKPVDKVEPKFKVGDWVVLNGVNGNPVQITSFEEDKGVGIKVWFSNGTGTWVDYLKGYHKWTIEDARDGDVLADNVGVILFKSIRDNNVINYYAYLSGIFSVQKDEEYWGYAVNCTLSPATKEQRERFFAAMHDAGYEWNAEKKELKKISQRMISAEAKEAMYGKPAAWSGEDNTYYDDICEILINLIHSETAKVNKDVVQKDLDWLISIKNRVIPQPMQEWNKEDEKMYRRLYNLIYFTPYCDSRKKLSDWLKSIKQKIVTK